MPYSPPLDFTTMKAATMMTISKMATTLMAMPATSPPLRPGAAAEITSAALQQHTMVD